MSVLQMVQSRGRQGFTLFGAISLLLLAAAAWAVVQAPQDQVQGITQKIFYGHISVIWTGYLMLLGTFLAAVVVLASDAPVDSAPAMAPVLVGATAEVAFVFITLVNLTGPIWAKPIWGTWWSWDARLTASFVLWLLLAVMLLLRANLPRDWRSHKVTAVVALLATLNVPIVHYSVRWWRTLHPAPVVMQDKVGGGLDAAMVPALILSLVAATSLGLTLLLGNVVAALNETRREDV